MLRKFKAGGSTVKQQIFFLELLKMAAAVGRELGLLKLSTTEKLITT
jgi:hypothetical protein